MAREKHIKNEAVEDDDIAPEDAIYFKGRDELTKEEIKSLEREYWRNTVREMAEASGTQNVTRADKKVKLEKVKREASSPSREVVTPKSISQPIARPESSHRARAKSIGPASRLHGSSDDRCHHHRARSIYEPSSSSIFQDRAAMASSRRPSHVNGGSAMRNEETWLWNKDELTNMEQERLWDLVAVREPRLKAIKAGILTHRVPNLARNILSQRLVDLKWERWSSAGIFKSKTGAPDNTAVHGGDNSVASQDSSLLSGQVAPTGPGREVFETAVGSFKFPVENSNDRGKKFREACMARAVAAGFTATPVVHEEENTQANDYGPDESFELYKFKREWKKTLPKSSRIPSEAEDIEREPSSAAVGQRENNIDEHVEPSTRTYNIIEHSQGLIKLNGAKSTKTNLQYSVVGNITTSKKGKGLQKAMQSAQQASAGASVVAATNPTITAPTHSSSHLRPGKALLNNGEIVCIDIHDLRYKKNKDLTPSERKMKLALSVTNNAEISQLRTLSKRSKGQKKRLRQLENAELEKWIVKNATSNTVKEAASVAHSQIAVVKNGENSNQDTIATTSAPIKKSRDQKRKERLERERLAWEAEATTNDQPSNQVAQGSTSRVAVNVVEKVDKHDKKDQKRKRAASNVSTSSHQAPSTQNVIKKADRAASPGPSKKKQKKSKKSKNDAETKQEILVINAEDARRNSVDKIKRSLGKTVSNKHKKKEAEKAKLNSKKTHDTVYNQVKQDIPTTSKSKKRNLDGLSKAQENTATAEVPHKDKKQKLVHDEVKQESGHQTQASNQKDVELRRKHDALMKTVLRGSTSVKSAPADEEPSNDSSDDDSDAHGPNSKHTGSSDRSETSSPLITPKKNKSRPTFESPVRPPLTFAQCQRSASVLDTPTKSRTKATITESPQIATSADLVNAVSLLKQSVNHLSNAFSTLLSPNAMDWTPKATNYTPLGSAARVAQKKKDKTIRKNSKGVQVDRSPQYMLIGAPSQEIVPVEPTWEDKSGKFRAKITDSDGNSGKETIAFSSSYIAKKEIVTFSEASFTSYSLAAQENVLFGAETERIQPKVELCVVIEGKVKNFLRHSDEDEVVVFEVSKGGIWRIKAGETCEVHAIDIGKGKQKEGEPIVLVHVFGVN